MTDLELELELVDLGGHLAVPAAGSLPTRVVAAITAAPRPSLRRRLVILVVAIGVGIGAVAAAPVVAEWLGVGGVEVRREPPPVAPRLGVPLDLGRPVTLAEAAALVDFELAVPAALGQPDEVWVDDSSGVAVVQFLYRPRAGLPAAAATGIGALFTQAQVTIADELFATKFAEANTTVEAVDLGSGRALWVSGIHSIAFRDQQNNVLIDRLRLADNVLLWERSRVTLRLETGLGRDQAIRIAKSVG